MALKSVHQPPFLDPYLFRHLVMSDRVRPTELIRRIESQEYDLIVSTAQIMDPGYDKYDFGYPRVVAEVIRRRYEFGGRAGGQFLYRPRMEAPKTTPES